MSGIWARTLVYLGLREEPEDHVEWDVLEAADTGDVAVVPPAAPVPPARTPAPRAVVRPPDAPVAAVRPIRAVPVPPASGAPVEDAGAGERVAVVQVRVFDDVETVGAHHRAGRPVLLDVSAAERPTARRAIDFLSGLTYASGGSLRRVSRGGFLLLPAGVDLDAAERTRLARLGYPVDGPERA